MQFDVVGVGCSCIDYLAIVPYYPKLDTRIKIEKFSIQGRGPVATALVTLARLGASVCYVGKTGDDSWGDFIRHEFQEEGVDTRGIIIQRGTRSHFAFQVVDKMTGKRTIIWTQSNLQDIKREELDKKLITSGKLLFLDETEIEAALVAAKWAKDSGIKVTLDINEIQPGIEELIKQTNVLIISSEFCRDFVKVENPLDAAKARSSLGPEMVVITRGKRVVSAGHLPAL